MCVCVCVCGGCGETQEQREREEERQGKKEEKGCFKFCIKSIIIVETIHTYIIITLCTFCLWSYLYLHVRRHS